MVLCCCEQAQGAGSRKRWTDQRPDAHRETHQQLTISVPRRASTPESSLVPGPLRSGQVARLGHRCFSRWPSTIRFKDLSAQGRLLGSRLQAEVDTAPSTPQSRGGAAMSEVGSSEPDAHWGRLTHPKRTSAETGVRGPAPGARPAPNRSRWRDGDDLTHTLLICLRCNLIVVSVCLLIGYS